MNYTLKKIVNIVFKSKLVRDWMVWGTYGKTGKEPLKWVLLRDMSDDHIQAILDSQKHISRFYRRELKLELKFREKVPSCSIKETKQ